MNEWLFTQHDSSWFDPFAITHADPRGDELEELAHRWSQLGRPADLLVKDPRLCLTLPWWRRVWEDELDIILLVRNPVQVARSLHRRNGFSRQLGEMLWYEYVASSFRVSEGLNRVLVLHDELMRQPATTLKRVITKLGFQSNASVDTLGSAAVDPALTDLAVVESATIPLVDDLWRTVSAPNIEGADLAQSPPPLPPLYVGIARTIASADQRARQAEQRELAAVNARQAIIHSRSWRLTRPIRAIGRKAQSLPFPGASTPPDPPR
jgi:hypothetical protein